MSERKQSKIIPALDGYWSVDPVWGVDAASNTVESLFFTPIIAWSIVSVWLEETANDDPSFVSVMPITPEGNSDRHTAIRLPSGNILFPNDREVKTEEEAIAIFNNEGRKS